MTPLEAFFLVLAVAVVCMWATSMIMGWRHEQRRQRELAELRAEAARTLVLDAPLAPKWDTSADICANCRSWNHAKGQAVIDEHPAFKVAATMLPPQVMGSVVDDDGKRVDNSVPEDCRWEDFGACRTFEELRWAKHTCDQFDRVELVQRLLRQHEGQLAAKRRLEGAE